VTPDRLQLMVMALPAPGALGYYRPVRVLPGWLRVSLSTTPTPTALLVRR